jgi:hypothetical protein
MMRTIKAAIDPLNLLNPRRSAALKLAFLEHFEQLAGIKYA